VTVTEIGRHPQRLDLTVHAGDPIDIAIPVLDSAGVAVSLTSWTCAAHVIDVNGTVLWDFTPSIVADEIRVAATAAQTGGWAWQYYAARLVITATPPAGAPTPIAIGWIRFYPR
jgi:hypothetical protein